MNDYAIDEAVEKEEIDETSYLMDSPFDPTKINIDTKTPSLDTLIKRISNGSIELNTESYFQRKDDLWNATQQSRLIESILIRFPLPAFFLDASEDSKWLVVDGLQRLSSIRNFCVKKTLSLTNLEFLTQLNGKKWDDLPLDLHRLIEETTVVIFKIMPGTPTEVKFNVFKRINTGGLVLESQEIRHALFQGRPSRFIADLAKDPNFIAATSNSIRPDRMLDRDFANRFLAFYLFNLESYNSDLESFMARAMASINWKSDQELAEIMGNFSQSMRLAYRIFGQECFRKVTNVGYQRTPPINKALFDAISTQFAKLDDTERKKLEAVGKQFQKTLKNELSINVDFYASITSSTGARRKAIVRHHVIRQLIQRFL